MQKKKLAVPLAAAALVLSAGGGLVAVTHADSSATSAATSQNANPQNGQERQKPAAVGQVTAINGSTITLTDKMSNTTYTVDASSAKLYTHSAPSAAGQKPTQTAISVADVKVGDTLMVQGTVNGSTITATTINDGLPMGGRGWGGHGRPGVRGTVTAVNGSTLTVKGQDGTTYTVDASSAKASKMQTISVSDISVGDSVNVNGTVSGTSVTAKQVMDGMPTPPQQGS